MRNKRRKFDGEFKPENETLAREMMEVVGRNYKQIEYNFARFVFKEMPNFNLGVIDAKEVINLTTVACYSSISKFGIDLSGDSEKSYLNYFYFSLRQNIVVYNANLITKKRVESDWIGQDEPMEDNLFETKQDAENKQDVDSASQKIAHQMFFYVQENFPNKDYQVFHSFYYNFFISTSKQNKTSLSKGLKMSISNYNEALERTTHAVREHFRDEFQALCDQAYL